GVTTVTGPDGTDTVTNVEQLQFADMVTNAAGDPPALPPSGDKSAAGPEVLPVAPGETAKDVEPQVLPAAPGEEGDDAAPAVLPPASDLMVKDLGPETLPGETDVFPTRMWNQLTAADFAPRDGDMAATLSQFSALTLDDGNLFAAAQDTGAPEVLPFMDGDFVLTAKF